MHQSYYRHPAPPHKAINLCRNRRPETPHRGHACPEDEDVHDEESSDPEDDFIIVGEVRDIQSEIK